MEELVYKSSKGNPVTTSLIVAEVFEKDHKHVIESIRNIMRYAENSAHLYHSTTYMDSMNRTREMFIMTEDGFSLLAMGFTGEKAIQWKIKYVEAFRKMREVITDYMALIPKTYAGALELAAKQAREIEEKNTLISLQAPKAHFVDQVIGNEKDMVDIGQSAKLLKLPFGRNTFFKKLRDDRVFFKNRNEPMQEYVDRKYFDLRELTIKDEEGETIKIVKKVYVTQKGLFWLSKKYMGRSKHELLTLTIQ